MHHIRVPAEAFIAKWARDPKSVAGKHSPTYQLICSEQGTLYSYGTHFPLAKFEDGFFFVNFQQSTNTTNGHRSHLLADLPESKVVRCLGSLDEEGAIQYLERGVAHALEESSHTCNKHVLFLLAYDPKSLILSYPGLKSYLGDKDIIKTLWTKATDGSFLKRVTAALLGKKADFTGPVNGLLSAIFNKPCTDKFAGLKFIQHFHAVGAAAVAAQLSSEDGGTALRLVNED
jgi:hypothetical protein